MQLENTELRVPLPFRPVYQRLIWGGRRLERWRLDLPPGPIGESWDLADHQRGMSVVAHGPLAGLSLRELMNAAPAAMVGPAFQGGSFPLMVKVLDASDRLSVQVHPDDEMARFLGVGNNGKTECWVILADGGAVFQGTQPGVDRADFESALRSHHVASTLNRFEGRTGDVFFLEARTVHALGEGCLLYEIQQTSDLTFRVYDWDRVGLDGKPRPLHLAESLATIDFDRTGFGPHRPDWSVSSQTGVAARTLADCRYFSLEEMRLPAGATEERSSAQACAVVTCVEGQGEIRTHWGACPISPLQTILVPAAAQTWHATSDGAGMVLLVASPQL